MQQSINPADALKIVLGVRTLPPCRTELGRALACVLAENICADRDQPPADRSAMDGFAVRADDLATMPRTLRLAGEVAAGSSQRPVVRPGTCVRILTGANLPPGANAVVMLEFTAPAPRPAGEKSGEFITFHKPARAGENIRRRGEEARKGQTLLTHGTVLGPLTSAVAASVGKAHVKVHPRPQAAVLVTGREVKSAGDRVGLHQLRDANGPALKAAFQLAGIDAAVQIVPDSLGATLAAIRKAAAAANVIILTGGVSVGKYDLVPAALEQLGAKVKFHGVNMKPGRPQMYATLARPRGKSKASPATRTVHIFGLPGNPMSVMTGFHELALPCIRRLSGLPREQCLATLRLPLAADVRAKGGRTWFAPARLTCRNTGLAVELISSLGSADIIGASAADGVAVIPPSATQLSAGELVDFRPWLTGRHR